MRRYHPDHQALTDEFKKNASSLQTAAQPPTRDLISIFEALPLSKKLAIVSMLSGGAGAVSNIMSPRPDESDLSDTQRGLRGAGRGAAIGAGGLLGAEAGKDLAKQLSEGGADADLGNNHWVAQTGGAIAGGLAAKDVAEKVLRRD